MTILLERRPQRKNAAATYTLELIGQCDKCKDSYPITLRVLGRGHFELDLPSHRHLAQHGRGLHCICGGRVRLFRWF